MGVSTNESRTLRSIQVGERRKGSRADHHLAKRGLLNLEECVEENLVEEQENGIKSTENPGKLLSVKSKSRMEKLQEYKKQKEKVKIEEKKKKVFKPFKVGKIHHSMNPFDIKELPPLHDGTKLKTPKSVKPAASTKATDFPKRT